MAVYVIEVVKDGQLEGYVGIPENAALSLTPPPFVESVDNAWRLKDHRSAINAAWTLSEMMDDPGRTFRPAKLPSRRDPRA